MVNIEFGSRILGNMFSSARGLSGRLFTSSSLGQAKAATAAGSQSNAAVEAIETLLPLETLRPTTVTIRGAHTVNKGSVAGSAEIAEQIEKTGLFTDRGNWGHGAYGHYLRNKELYQGTPHVIFEATVPIKNIERVRIANGQSFFRIRNNNENLPVKILGKYNLDK